MLRSLVQPSNRTASVKSIPACVKGWNSRDSIANMEQDYAILLDNFFPTPSDVMLRKGYSQHATGLPGAVETVMAYNAATSANQKLFAISGTAIYDVTSAGAVGAAAVSGLTNARWQHVNFATTAAQYLLLVNGVDTGRRYDTSGGWTTWTVTNVNTSACSNVSIHKNRIWLVEKDTLNAWYVPTDAITGAAVKFPLTGVAKKGGRLVAIGTWTIDAGEGIDDHWVAITSEGEAIVYKGTDPSAAATWTLVGVWALGQPIGNRCLGKLAGDLVMICTDGVVPLSRYLASDRVNPRVALTETIEQAMNDAATLYGDNFGWQICFYPNGTMMILNVPVNENDNQQQYAMNTIHGAWGRFKNVEANCWEIFQDEPYFGGSTFVGIFWDDFNDNDANIEGALKQAFNYYGSRGESKMWKRGRVIFASDGQPAALLGLNTDFRDDRPSGSLTFTPSTYALWDSAVWDTGLWGGGLAALTNWQQLSGYGKCAALRLEVASKDLEVRYQGYDHLFERTMGRAL